jgi:hypothetical protein
LRYELRENLLKETNEDFRNEQNYITETPAPDCGECSESFASRPKAEITGDELMMRSWLVSSPLKDDLRLESPLGDSLSDISSKPFVSFSSGVWCPFSVRLFPLLTGELPTSIESLELVF